MKFIMEITLGRRRGNHRRRHRRHHGTLLYTALYNAWLAHSLSGFFNAMRMKWINEMKPMAASFVHPCDATGR